MDSNTPHYPVPKDLIFDSGHLERILIALLRAEISVSFNISVSNKKPFWVELSGLGWAYSNDITSALDIAISKLPDNLRWDFFEEYDKTSSTSTKNS